MVYVLDSSFVASVILPDENNQHAEKMYVQITNSNEKQAPNLFWYEMANIFMSLIRRKRYTYDEVMQLMPVFSSIQLKIDYESGPDYAQKLLRLCSDYNLSSYDAAYLELAKRKNATLCTLDQDLSAAAKKLGVPVLT
jgi:predicted nucleic acid-binding protein